MHRYVITYTTTHRPVLGPVTVKGPHVETIAASCIEDAVAEVLACNTGARIETIGRLS